MKNGSLCNKARRSIQSFVSLAAIFVDNVGCYDRYVVSFSRMTAMEMCKPPD